MNEVKVSVIIPFFNAQNLIERCILSVSSQSLRDIEIICVDDGSSDQSYEIVSSISQLDRRIIPLRFPKNLGVAVARNKGISIAKGEFVYFVDADDYLPNQSALEILYDNAKKYEAEISGGNVVFDNPYKYVFNQINFPNFKRTELIQFKKYQFFYGFWCFLYSRKFLIKNKIEFPELLRFQDPPFLISAMVKATKICASPTNVYSYRLLHKKIFEGNKINDIISGIKLSMEIAKSYDLSPLHQKLQNIYFKIMLLKLFSRIGLPENLIWCLYNKLKKS